MVWRKALFFLNPLYAFAVTLRNWAYDRGLRRTVEFDVPVIGLGNLHAGGTGKSPHAAWVVTKLKRAGYNPAILSRGYGRFTKGFRMVRPDSPYTEVGDEPLMLFQQTKAPVAVCEDRVMGIPLTLAESGAQGIVLDDCLQHRGVKPTLLFLLCPWNQPYFNESLLPAGNLREPKSGAARAQALILTRVPLDLSGEERKAIKASFSDFPEDKIFLSSLQYASLQGAGTLPDEGSEVLLLTGIANPAALAAYISSKFTIHHHVAFGDHHHFSKNDLSRISALAAGRPIITTAKDAVRLPHWFMQEQAVWVQPIEPVFDSADERALLSLLTESWKKKLTEE